jgi:hypothetical protein
MEGSPLVVMAIDNVDASESWEWTDIVESVRDTDLNVIESAPIQTVWVMCDPEWT